jgi:amino acid permease
MATDDNNENNPNKVTKKGKDVFSPPPPKDIKTAEYVSNFLVTIGLLGTLVTFFMHESFTTKSEFTIRCCSFFALYVIGASPLMYLFPGGERYKNKRKKEEQLMKERQTEEYKKKRRQERRKKYYDKMAEATKAENIWKD